KMFQPMALTVIFALSGSLLLSLTATPVLASVFLKPGMSERDTIVVRWAKRLYEPILKAAVRHPVPVPLASLASLLVCVPVARGLGGEFIPQLDEGDLIIAQIRPASSSLHEAIADSTRLEKAIRESFPDEVRAVVSRIGRPEIGLEAG